MKITSFFATVLLTGWSMLSGQAAAVLLSIPASQNTFVLANNSHSLGASNYLECTYGGMIAAQAYLQFDLTSLPPAAQITSAHVRLYYGYAGGTPTIAMYYVGWDYWSESGMTWGDKPEFSHQITQQTPGRYGGWWTSWDLFDAAYGHPWDPVPDRIKQTLSLGLQAIGMGPKDSSAFGYFYSKENNFAGAPYTPTLDLWCLLPDINPIPPLHIQSSGSAANDWWMVVTLPTNQTYEVDWSADLRNWQPLTNGIPGTGQPLGIYDSNALAQWPLRFYRLSFVNKTNSMALDQPPK